MKNIALLFFSVILTLCVLEIVYYVHHNGKISQFLANKNPEELITRSVDDGRIYELKPNTSKTNSFGFYDIEWPQDTTADTIRIAVVGDSVTMQRNTPRSESYVRKLEVELNRRLKTHKVVLMNFAITGYGTRQELILLEKEILPKHDIDIILWQFHYNDSIDPRYANADGGLSTYYAKPFSYFWKFLRGKYYDHDKMWFKYRNSMDNLPSGLADQMYNYNEIDRIIDKVTYITRSKGILLYAYVYPSWPWDNNWESFTKRGFDAHDKIIQHFTTKGIPTLDFLKIFQKEEPKKLRASPTDPWHPNSAGYEIIESELANWLLLAEEVW